MKLIVSVTGVIDQETGYVIDMKVLKNIIKNEIEDVFDHKNLNIEIPEFKDLNPTSEVLVTVIFDLLSPHLPNLQKTGLWETEKNYFEYEKIGVSI